MREKIKNHVMVIFTLMILFALSIILLLAKLDDYHTGVTGNYSINATYTLITDNPIEQLYLSMDEREGVFFHLKDSQTLIQLGTLKKGEFYTLYKDDTEVIYGKIIKSYNKIYFIDEGLNVSVYERSWDGLTIPSSYNVPKESDSPNEF